MQVFFLRLDHTEEIEKSYQGLSVLYFRADRIDLGA
jgi:hypothetical protein